MRHHTWDMLSDRVGQIAERLGCAILDNRCGKRWDPGQAICAEAYGPDWWMDPEFRRVDQLGDDERAPQSSLDAAERLAEGQLPDWVEVQK